VDKVADGLYDVHVFPHNRKDKTLYGDRRDYIRVKGNPKQINPLEKEGGIIAVLGAGNYSSSIEMITALFLENCTVVHRPHHLNEETDKVWDKIMQPLVDYKALSFCSSKGGRELVKDPRLKKIYFTGSTEVAQKIMSTTNTEFISECGGNNPCIVVPGDKPWTQKQLHHQAMQIATVAKMNGGAVCGRPQTLVTSKNWPQREMFLKELENALEIDTPAVGSYYPGSQEKVAAFREQYPDADVLKPEHGKFKNTDFLFIPGVEEDGYAIKNEAFTQILSEVALDTPPDADSFLPKAVEFCNTKLLGTLGSSILIDDETLENHKSTLEQAVTDMKYGAVGVNTMPPFIWLNPYLTWGGNEEGGAFVSGVGNFGNVLNFENVEKSIAYSNFMSQGHMIIENKKSYHHLLEHMSVYSVEPTWMHLSGLATSALAGRLRHKDF
jgi:acyl-CoA reductase-like NAD-dependent aldehyde dehydrogenase